MNIPAKHLPVLQELSRSQPLAALAADAGSHPYVSLVAVAITNDLRHLYFATPRATSKWANLTKNPRVSLLLDNRTNQVSDFPWVNPRLCRGPKKFDGSWVIASCQLLEL